MLHQQFIEYRDHVRHKDNKQSLQLLYKQVEVNAAAAKERYTCHNSNSEDADSSGQINGIINGDVEEEEDSSEGEEYPEDNNEEPGTEDREDPDDDDVSVSSSFVDSGIENNEVSSLSIENGHTSGEG